MVKRLLLLNGLAVLGAVVHHAVSWDLTAMFFWTDRYLPVSVPNFDQIWGLRYIILRLLDQLAVPGVFAFLVVSGYFIAVAAGNRQRTLGWRLVFQRLKTLAIPYLIWSFVLVAFNLLQGQTYSPSQVASLFLTGGAAAPYYYVPLLLQLYLLSPFLVPLAREHWKWLLGITAFIQLPVTLAHYVAILKLEPGVWQPGLNVLRDWHLLGYAFWFVLGMVIGFHLEAFKGFLQRARVLLVAGLALTFVASILEWELLRQAYGKEWLALQVTLSAKLFVLFILLCFFAFDRLKFPYANRLAQLGAKSFGVYLIHSLFLELAARGIYHVAPWLLAYQLPFLGLLVAVGVVIPLVMMWVVDRTPALRRFYGYLYG
jgi:peptidoglycan/LPS O-acetylase OafA/YrhL